MASTENLNEDFDLTPHPRILPMLGEIQLQQWRCIAELIDNSVDSFMEATRAGTPIQHPMVIIQTPMGNPRRNLLSVTDNGPGMDISTLERAAKAGWSSHGPVDNLGLFGMGFNIATARLGQRTTIWTTRIGQNEWVGIEIDFEKLSREQRFITPKKTRIKLNSDVSGTEVIVERLKPEQLEWFSKAANRTLVSKQLGKIYSSMIGPANSPIGFKLQVNGNPVKPKLHCIWGGPGNTERAIDTALHGQVNAFQPFDKKLEPRLFCSRCWIWLGHDQTNCPSCEAADSVIQRERRVHGWLGIQRYVDADEYGIDMLRNGRKIEIGNKDLFLWFDEDTDEQKLEYPFDDQRRLGRIVGEVHLDHCRVPYTKDRFMREDAAWNEMREIVRGKSSLHPTTAKEQGYGPNHSPLYLLFQVFRRSNPQNKNAGGWSRLLLVKDNNQATQMARKFDAGEPEYQTDQKWWDLIEEAEASVLRSSTATGQVSDILGEPQYSESTGSAQTNDGIAAIQTTPVRNRIASLSQQYVDDLTEQRFDVKAFSVSAEDPNLAGIRCPWTIKRTTSGPYEFFVNVNATAFRSMTLTPLDALLSNIASLAIDYRKDQGSQFTFGEILTSLRERYTSSLMLNSGDLISEAYSKLIDIARSIVGRISSEDARTFFDNLGPSQQERIQVNMASRRVTNPRGAIDDGRYLQFSPPSIISEFVLSNPALFFDGTYWDDAYLTLDYGSSVATSEAQARIIGNYSGLLSDTVWLAEQTPSELDVVSRERLMRASLATSLLSPTATIGDS